MCLATFFHNELNSVSFDKCFIFISDFELYQGQVVVSGGGELVMAKKCTQHRAEMSGLLQVWKTTAERGIFVIKK